MKKFLLFVSFSLIATIGGAQVIFFVEPPSSNAGNYDMNYADAADGWGCPDMTLPANAITGEICMADDGTSADSLACINSVNANVSGKIAVLYRGDCQFGVKALNCQNAGAIGVIIINNVPGDVTAFGMLGGTDGPSVTVPVVMISDNAGAALKAEAEACSGTTVFIGNKLLNFADDLGFYPEHILRAKQFGNIQALSQDDTEFEVGLGGWVYNYGSDAQTNVTLTANIPFGSYSQTSTPVASLASGDSVFIPVGTYSETSYANGYYDVTYHIDSDATADDFPYDDTLKADFMMSDSIYSYARVDAGTYKPEGDGYYRGSQTTLTNSSCLTFDNANGSRVGIHGMTFSATTYDSLTMDGQFIEITAYQWLDNFVDLNDGNADITNLVSVAGGEYYYIADLKEENIYIPFVVPVLLEDNQRYLFCMKHTGEDVFSAFDTKIDYGWNLEEYLQPQFPIEADGAWNMFAFGTGTVPALTVNMFPTAVGIENYTKPEINSYPNPASAEINIPLGENYGDVSLIVTDMNGKTVKTENVNMTSPLLTVDVTTLPSGLYIFNLTHGDNETLQFKVNVSR
jgi:hypothetical protein